MVMKNFVVITVAFFLGLFLVPQSFAANGAVNCQPVYGGGQTCVQAGNLVINKTVQNPQGTNFVDNLGINDPKYAPTQTVNFKITVTNSGNSTLSTVTVKDIIPQFVTFVAGPGNFDTGSKTLTFQLSDLKANESRTFDLSGKVVAAGSLPSDKGVVCAVNQATATSNNHTSQDNAQFCIEKQAVAPQAATQPGAQPSAPTTTKGGLKVFPAPQTQANPATGPEALVLMALLPTGIFGAILRKRSSAK